MTDNTDSQTPNDSTERQTQKDPDASPLVQHPSPDSPPSQQNPPLDLVQKTVPSHTQETTSPTGSEPATTEQTQHPTEEHPPTSLQQPPIAAYASTEAYTQIATPLCRLYADVMQFRKAQSARSTPVQDSTRVLEQITKSYTETLSELAQTDWVTDTCGQVMIKSPDLESAGSSSHQAHDTQISRRKQFLARSQLIRGLNIIGTYIESPPADTPQAGTVKTLTRTIAALTTGLTSLGYRPWSSLHQERPDIQPSGPTVSWPRSHTADDTPLSHRPTQRPERAIIRLCQQPIKHELTPHSSAIHTTPVSEQNPYATLVAHTYIQAQYRELRQTHSPIPAERGELFSFQLEPDQYSQTVLLHLLAETQKYDNAERE